MCLNQLHSPFPPLQFLPYLHYHLLLSVLCTFYLYIFNTREVRLSSMHMGVGVCAVSWSPYPWSSWYSLLSSHQSPMAPQVGVRFHESLQPSSQDLGWIELSYTFTHSLCDFLVQLGCHVLQMMFLLEISTPLAIKIFLSLLSWSLSPGRENCFIIVPLWVYNATLSILCELVGCEFEY